jgi:hypothetical protein
LANWRNNFRLKAISGRAQKAWFCRRWDSWITREFQPLTSHAHPKPGRRQMRRGAAYLRLRYCRKPVVERERGRPLLVALSLCRKACFGRSAPSRPVALRPALVTSPLLPCVQAAPPPARERGSAFSGLRLSLYGFFSFGLLWAAASLPGLFVFIDLAGYCVTQLFRVR